MSKVIDNNLDKGWGVTRPHPDHPFLLEDVRDELENFRAEHKIKSIDQIRLDIIEDLFNSANYLRYSGNIRASLRGTKDWINPLIEEGLIKAGKTDELNELKQAKIRYAQNLLNIPWYTIPPKNGTNIAKAVWVYMQIHEQGDSLETSDSAELRDRMEIKANSLLSISEDKELRELALPGQTDPLYMNIKDKKIAGMLEVGAALKDFRQKLKVSKSVTFKSDPNGKKILFKPIEKYSDAIKASPINLVNENLFKYKLATKKIDIVTKVSPEERKQLLYMLVDSSGSMSQEFKIAAVNFVVANRLAAVKRGDAELYFSYYESRKFDEYNIANSESAKKFFHDVCRHNYSLGGTNINGVLKETIERCGQLVKEKGFVKPDIMIVCDGQDTVDGSMDCKGYTVHTVHLDQFNPELAKLSSRSGGMVVEITEASLKKNNSTYAIETLVNPK